MGIIKAALDSFFGARPAGRLVLIIALAAVFMLAGCSQLKQIVADNISGGGEGTFDPGDIEVLDGGETYIDNSALWPALEGTWASEDGRWQAVIGENTGIALTMDGETVLNSSLSFTYLQPGGAARTELEIEPDELKKADGTLIGEADDLYYDSATGTIQMEIELENDREEIITLQKTRE